jgi:hypothetical protein
MSCDGEYLSVAGLAKQAAIWRSLAADRVQSTFMIVRATGDSSVALMIFFKFLKAKPAGRVPPDALLFVQAATKSKQKAPFSLRRAFPLPGFRDVKTLV